MKRHIVIELKIDPEEYHEAKDTPEGCVDLVIACLREEADFATRLRVTCEDVTKAIKLS